MKRINRATKFVSIGGFTTLFTLLIFSNSARATVLYQVTAIESLGGDAYGYAVNASGQVAAGAYASGSGDEQAILFDAGATTNLGILPGYTSASPFGMNDLGQVVGYCFNNNSSSYDAFLFSNGIMTGLGTLGGTFSIAFGVNAKGQVVGGSGTSSGYTHAILYSNGEMADLGIASVRSVAQGINDSGQVVGFYEASNGNLHAFLYSGSTLTDLGTLGGISSDAQQINSSGAVVGYADTAADDNHAFLYSDGTMHDLGTASGWKESEAFGINDLGQIVGNLGSLEEGATTNGFLYSDGVMTDLNTLLDSSSSGWTVTGATEINDNGWIAATATQSYDGISYAVLLTPVPEPSGMVLVASAGLIVIGLAIRRYAVRDSRWRPGN